VRQPVNTVDPHRSLLTPLYSYDIERAIRDRRSLRASVIKAGAKNVQVTDEQMSRKSKSAATSEDLCRAAGLTPSTITELN